MFARGGLVTSAASLPICGLVAIDPQRDNS